MPVTVTLSSSCGGFAGVTLCQTKYLLHYSLFCYVAKGFKEPPLLFFNEKFEFGQAVTVAEPGRRRKSEVLEDEKRDLNDIVVEETSRGQRQPKRALSLARQRMIRRIAKLLADPNCEEATYLETIRAFGLQDESQEFQKLLALWRKRRGNE